MPESAGPAGDYLRLHILHTYGRAAAAARGGADTVSPAPGPRAGAPAGRREKKGGAGAPPLEESMKKGAEAPRPRAI